jgi:pimeloyl-ACP methyl ester carboxylesterase
MLPPRMHSVTCSSPAGLHRMAYREWGDPEGEEVVLCVHGLTRTGRDFDALATVLLFMLCHSTPQTW